MVDVKSEKRRPGEITLSQYKFWRRWPGPTGDVEKGSDGVEKGNDGVEKGSYTCIWGWASQSKEAFQQFGWQERHDNIR
jgi:hypothetical protein